MRRGCPRRPPCGDRYPLNSHSVLQTISSKCSDVRPTLADRIGHIEAAIGNIRRILAGHTRETFANDMVVRLAVERLLEIISEASRFIPEDRKAKTPAINWRGLSDLGNWLRH